TMLAVRHHVIEAVLNANYEISGLTGSRLEYDSDDWPGSIVKLSGTTRLAPVVRAAVGRFGFLASRNDTAYNNWVVSPRCPGLRHQLRRRGATQMDEQGRWQSVDTLSYHALRSNRWIGCYYREYPMGWGWLASAADQILNDPHMPTPPDDFSESDFWRWVQEHTDWDIATGSSNPLANSRALVGKRLWNTAGLPELFDLAESAKNATIGFSLSLYRSTDGPHIISTRSAAETFFARPDAYMNGRDEYASLFRPYWQA